MTYRYTGDMIGRRFGRLVVTDQEAQIGRDRAWKCLCDCGAFHNVSGSDLRTGNTKSCGCLKIDMLRERLRKHGMCKTREYTSWAGMKKRCGNPNAANYTNYGGRGITVCERWQSFDNFIADMGSCPSECSIERINNEQGYSPDNCRWATNIEQRRNRRQIIKGIRLIRFNGTLMTVYQLSKLIGIKPTTLRDRIDRGWTDEHLASRPAPRP